MLTKKWHTSINFINKKLKIVKHFFILLYICSKLWITCTQKKKKKKRIERKFFKLKVTNFFL